MKLTEVVLELKSRSDRVEIFPFGDVHIGKSNCAESAVKKQINYILSRAEKPGIKVIVVFGGDICDYIQPGDRKRFNPNTLADWAYDGSAETIRETLNNINSAELKRAIQIFSPLKPFAIGGIEGNHEFAAMQYNNRNVHQEFCDAMEMSNLTDEAMIRIVFKNKVKRGAVRRSHINLYLQHGNGGGRSPGAEAIHLTRIRDEWEWADIVFRGDSHTFEKLAPKAVQYIPSSGSLPDRQLIRYRYAANWGCWVYSHKVGPSTYESRAVYPSRAMMSVKACVWPFYHYRAGKKDISGPKIELRDFSLL